MKLLDHAVVAYLILGPLSAQERVREADLIHNLSEHFRQYFRAMESPRKLTLTEARHAQELRYSTHNELSVLMSAADEIRTARREILTQSMARLYRHVECDVVRRRWEALRAVLLNEVPAHLRTAEILWREGAKDWAANIPPKKKNRRDFPHFFRDGEGQRVAYVAPVLGYEDYLEFRRYADRLSQECAWLKNLEREISGAREAVREAWRQ